jgi:hypothetical protein
MNGPGKKVFRSGNIVTKNDFQAGQLEKHLADGNIVEIDNELSKPLEGNLLNDEPLFTIQKDGETHSVFGAQDITKNEISQELESRNIEFDLTNKKDVLFALLVENLG